MHRSFQRLDWPFCSFFCCCCCWDCVDFFQWNWLCINATQMSNLPKWMINKKKSMKKWHTKCFEFGFFKRKFNKITSAHTNTRYTNLLLLEKRQWNETTKRSHNARSRIGLIKWTVIVTTIRWYSIMITLCVWWCVCVVLFRHSIPLCFIASFLCSAYLMGLNATERWTIQWQFATNSTWTSHTKRV